MNGSVNRTGDFAPARYYAIIVPVLMIGLSTAVLGNLYLLLCIRWIRTQALTANLRLSLSLAGADLWAGVLLLNGLVVNNVIPHLMETWFGHWVRCYMLVFELLRVAGLITSAAHLLALALNHCFSIVSPLKYQTTVTPSFSYICILFLWMAPLVSNFVLASSYEGDGFRTRLCEIGFYFRFRYRLGIFLQFVIPLLIMLLIYTYILIRLSAARRRCAFVHRRLAHRSSRISSDQQALFYPINTGRKGTLEGPKEKRPSGDSVLSHFSAAKNGSVMSGKKRKQSTESRSSSVFSFNRLNAVKSKARAVTTTMLIVGTFVLGWLPAVFVFLLICRDCLYTQGDLAGLDLLAVNSVVNVMIVVKLILNPLIYAYRLVEIRYALWVMHATRFGHRPLDLNQLPARFRKMAPSVSANLRTQNGSPCVRSRQAAVSIPNSPAAKAKTTANGANYATGRPSFPFDQEGSTVLGVVLEKALNEGTYISIQQGKGRKQYSWHEPGAYKLIRKE